jgi:hypothetical protein
MAVRLLALCALSAVIYGCGGPAASGTSQPPGSSQAPGGPTSTVGPTVGGGAQDSTGLGAAFTALQAHDSWQFTVTYRLTELGEPVERTVTGTERRKPQVAVDASHPQPDGTSFRYIRIGDDIWANLGTAVFYHYDAAGSKNLISQYEDFYAAALVTTVTANTNIEFDPVGDDSVNGIAATHYRAPARDLENIAQLVSLTPEQWAADAWLAKDGGYLVRLAWGPKTLDTAQPLIGFDYQVTAVDCSCPIEPPTNVASP